jgi:hypothetical protein
MMPSMRSPAFVHRRCSVWLALMLLTTGCGGSVDPSTLVERDDATGPGSSDDAASSGDAPLADDTSTRPESTAPGDVDVGDVAVDAGPDGAGDATPGDAGSGETGSGDAGGAPCSEPTGKLFEGRCYFTVPTGPFSIVRAKCTDAGAHLVTITSAAEQAFVVPMITGDTWIGLQQTSGRFDVWLTGEPVVYRRWAVGEPNGSGSCVRLRGDGLWADNNCSLAYPAICERERP